MTTTRSASYRRGLRRGFDHARHAADLLEPPLTPDSVAGIGAPSDVRNPEEYREGYRDGIARHDRGERRPRGVSVKARG